MRLYKVDSYYVWDGDFNTRHMPKTAKFRWFDGVKNKWSPKSDLIPAKSWWTDDTQKALLLLEYADESCKAELEQLKAEQEQKLKASIATDSELNIPAPEGFNYYGYQKAGIEYAIKNKNVLIGDEMGLGKSQPLFSKILTPDGWVKMGDITVGDLVIGSDGNPIKVVGVYPQGNLPIYRISCRGGSTTYCSGDHLWKVLSVYNGNRDGWVIRTTKELGDAKYKNGKNKWKLPIVSPINFSEKKFNIHPYLLGVIIGDGASQKSVNINIANIDSDIVKFISECGYDYSSSNSYVDSCTRYHYSGLMPEINRLGLNVKSKEKFIPNEYMFGSIQQRMELLQGLMDTDGSCLKNRTIFHTCSRQLALDVVYLVRSLGGIAIPREYNRNDRDVEWRINVKMFDCPFKTNRKKREWSIDNKTAQTIESIELVGEEMCQCISVDAQDQLYVTDDFIVTHNTIQAIGVINYNTEINKVLIVCPASLKLNWKKELKTWSTRDLSIKILSTGDATEGADIHIVNYDILAKAKLSWLKTANFDLVVADEAHYVKNPDAQRSKAFYAISEAASQKIMLTGTPIMNRPVELFHIVKSLGFEMDFWRYVQRYCDAQRGSYGWDFSGASNLEELQVKLRQSVMVRRKKSDVLHELPPKRRQIIELDPTKYTDYIEREQEFLNKITATQKAFNFDIDGERDINADREYDDQVENLTELSAADIGELARIRHETAVAKIGDVVEHVTEVLDSADKVIVFAHHRDVIEGIADAFGNSAVVLYGGMKDDEKDSSVTRFQNDPNVKVFVGSIKAAGVGLTLTEANVVIFAELDWTPANLTQAEDRAHRIGQTDSVLVQHIVIDGSIDSNLAKKVVYKQNIADRALNEDHMNEFRRQSEKQIQDAANKVNADIERAKERVAALKQKSDDRRRELENAISEKAQAEIIDGVPQYTTTQRDLILSKIKYLSNSCDGAYKLDGRGFNRVDAGFGHALAEKPTLSNRQAWAAQKMLRKYHGQIGNIDKLVEDIQ